MCLVGIASMAKYVDQFMNRGSVQVAMEMLWVVFGLYGWRRDDGWGCVDFRVGRVQVIIRVVAVVSRRSNE